VRNIKNQHFISGKIAAKFLKNAGTGVKLLTNHLKVILINQPTFRIFKVCTGTSSSTRQTRPFKYQRLKVFLYS